MMYGSFNCAEKCYVVGCSTIVYTLSTQSGSINGVEFECSLENTGGAVNATGTQDWKPCTSPVSYPKLADGRYNFDVRAKGEQIVQSTYFIKVCFTLSPLLCSTAVLF